MDRTSPSASTSPAETPESPATWQPVTIVTCYYVVTLGAVATRATRQAEYETALRANLTHPRVESVVVFVRGPEARARLATLDLPHREKDDGTCPLIDDFQGSHDGFLFRSPLTQIDVEAFDFFQFNPGSDNVIVEHLYARGYLLSNPCRRLKIIHLHKTRHREGDQTRVNDSFAWLEIPPLD